MRIAHYLTVALRQIARHRSYSAINIGGLALGLAGCLLILGYIRYEQSYDAWLPGQPIVHTQTSALGDVQTIALTPTPFALAGLMALAIALATVAGHALRVARASPIHALRYE